MKIIRRLTGLEKIKCSRCLRFATSVRFVWKLRSHFGFCSALRRLLLTVANSILVGVVRRQDKAKNSCPACQKGWNNQLGTYSGASVFDHQMGPNLFVCFGCRTSSSVQQKMNSLFYKHCQLSQQTSAAQRCSA